MTATELAVEHALICAGCWWPGARAEILAGLGGTNADAPDANALAALVEAMRADKPERFLPVSTLEQIAKVEDSANRYERTMKEIHDFRGPIVAKINSMRRDEPTADNE